MAWGSVGQWDSAGCRYFWTPWPVGAHKSLDCYLRSGSRSGRAFPVWQQACAVFLLLGIEALIITFFALMMGERMLDGRVVGSPY
ncbi:MAG: hypothetical protein CM1200mP41_09340 [Gammaproteobacteria bacterium]|nr:MAG: hypothetical protein CM1200mP41_09340 [Gammaproteobacteria bacterium]